MATPQDIGRYIHDAPGRVFRTLAAQDAAKRRAQAADLEAMDQVVREFASGLAGRAPAAPTTVPVLETSGSRATPAFPTPPRAPGAPPPLGTPRASTPFRAPEPAPPPSGAAAVLDDVVRTYDPSGDRAAVEGFRARQPSSYLRPLMQGSGDLESRAYAMKLLDDFYGTEEELRPDPMGDALEARQRTLAYEAQMPYGAMSTIRARYGSGMGPLSGVDIGSDAVGTRVMGEPTRAEELAIRTQQAKLAPDMIRARAEAGKAGAEGYLLQRRASIAEELQQLREDLNEDVRTGRRSPADATAEFERQVSRAQVMSDLLKNGVTPRGENDYASMPLPGSR